MTARERHYRLLLRRGFPRKHARRLATGYLIGIGLNDNTTFVAGRDDGFGSNDQLRRVAYRQARSIGINPTGKIWSPQLARPGLGMGADPEAWLDRGEARDQVKRICEQRGLGCEGAVNVKGRPPTHDPLAGPYEVADDIVQTEVQDILEDHGNEMTSKEKAELFDKTKERLSGRK